MSYIDGFVIAVPTANKQKFIEYAGSVDTIFTDLGATRVVECWADDVPEGKITDFGKAVMSKDFKDERMDMEENPVPFDGKSLIFGGFKPVVEL
jgi:uncharacterized protein YbaA (DUF1428 family)